MLEKNNLEIAEVIADWLDKQVMPAEATVGEPVGMSLGSCVALACHGADAGGENDVALQSWR
jgi:hypothetical protein